jgi:hypothetical protein
MLWLVDVMLCSKILCATNYLEAAYLTLYFVSHTSLPSLKFILPYRTGFFVKIYTKPTERQEKLLDGLYLALWL